MANSIFFEARNVYSWLEDEISKEVFLMRLGYSGTGDMRLVTSMSPDYRNVSADIELFAKKISSLKRKVIYGAGINGRAIAKDLTPPNVELFIDNYRKESIDSETGLRIITFDDYIRMYNTELNNVMYIISIINRETALAIRDSLLSVGVKNDNIVFAPADLRNNEGQYFDFFKPNENEVFVDCGGYDGATCYRFASWCGAKGYDYIYCFEPDKKSFERCKMVLESLEKCELFPYGTSNQQGKVYFKVSGAEDAHVVSEKEVLESPKDQIESIEVVSLDSFLGDKRVTFIKMDIEGEEWNTLLGAERIIREQRPRLAISIYHTVDDFIRIPVWLKSIHDDYKFYFRHYSLICNETVLYVE